MPSINKKAELRLKLRAKRQAIPLAARTTATDRLCANACQLPDFQTATHIAMYWPHDDEIDCIPLLQQALTLGKQCYLPVLCLKTRQTLAFATYTRQTLLVSNRYGILEPEIGYSNIIAIADLDLIFVPLVGFDDHGNRLGMGGGFYDTALADLAMLGPEQRPKLIGLAYSCQKIANIPTAGWDWPLDMVITEVETLILN